MCTCLFHATMCICVVSVCACMRVHVRVDAHVCVHVSVACMGMRACVSSVCAHVCMCLLHVHVCHLCVHMCACACCMCVCMCACGYTCMHVSVARACVNMHCLCVRLSVACVRTHVLSVCAHICCMDMCAHTCCPCACACALPCRHGMRRRSEHYVGSMRGWGAFLSAEQPLTPAQGERVHAVASPLSHNLCYKLGLRQQQILEAAGGEGPSGRRRFLPPPATRLHGKAQHTSCYYR